MIFKTEDGSYTPPSPDDTLRQALNYVSNEDYNKYCDSWNPDYGFSDDLNEEMDTCGTIWQQNFIQLQKTRLNQLQEWKSKKSSIIPKFVSYVCQEDPRHRGSHSCGGLADRMSGMISTFFYALLTDRGYLVNWEKGNPTTLEDVFEKPNIDWSFDPNEMKQLYDRKGNGYLSVNTLNFGWEKIRNAMFPDGPSQDFNELWKENYVEVKSNRGYIIRTFDYSTFYGEKLEQLGLTKGNGFRCLLDFLFRPTLGSRRFINAYKELFQMKSVLSIGLQIRTDDTALAHPEDDTNNFETWDYFLTCANKLRDAKRQPHHQRVVYFLLTDSNKLRQEFVSMNTDQALRDKYIQDDDTSMVVTGLPIEHIEAKTVKTKFEADITANDSDHQRLLAGVNSAVIDNWLLSYTDYRLISRQGFGKMAAFHATDPQSTISLPRLDRKDHVVNCANPHVFTSFDTLSTWWSLG
ncbi:hypothetical protein BJ944DRAFT_171877 [Cunninghamella echinulata]|nr:hypothetical protein BJ944DRAFT_171877 [Cunninghamella echinulata]